MTEMIDRVAKAIAVSDEANPPIACACSGKESPEDFACSCKMYAARRRAKVAIEEMRVPTEAMIEAGCDYDERHLNLRLGRAPTPEECQSDEWATMIDAALSPDQKEMK